MPGQLGAHGGDRRAALEPGRFSSDRAPIALITRTIAVPAGQGGRYAPWQFAMLAGLLDARDHAGRARDLDLDKPFASVWLGRAACTCRRIGPRRPNASVPPSSSATRARRNPKDRDLLIGSLAAPGLVWRSSKPSSPPWRRPTTPSSPTCCWSIGRRYSPSIRAAILDMLLSRAEWTSSLLSSLEDGCVPPAEIDPARRQQLLTRAKHVGSDRRAEAVFAHQSKPRQAVVDAYRACTRHARRPGRRRSPSSRSCVPRAIVSETKGSRSVPISAALNDKSPEALLIAILDPNRAFEAKFANFSIATVDGRVLNGLIASESATAVTLRRQDGKEDVLLRSQIDEMTASGQSLMPEGARKRPETP